MYQPIALALESGLVTLQEHNIHCIVQDFCCDPWWSPPKVHFDGSFFLFQTLLCKWGAILFFGLGLDSHHVSRWIVSNVIHEVWAFFYIWEHFLWRIEISHMNCWTHIFFPMFLLLHSNFPCLWLDLLIFNVFLWFRLRLLIFFINGRLTTKTIYLLTFHSYFLIKNWHYSEVSFSF